MREALPKFTTLLIALGAAAAAMADGVPRASLCTPQKDEKALVCRDIALSSLRRSVDALPAGTPYAIADEEWRQVTMTDSAAQLHVVSTSFAASDVSGAAVVTITRAQRHNAWTLALPVARLQSISSFRLPAGDYSLSVELPHAVRAQRTFAIPATQTLARVLLMPLPHISGSVVDSAGAPAVSAAVLDEARTVAMTDAAGRFSVEVADAWPSSLSITYPGYAAAHVAVPKMRASVQLPQIALSRGGSLEVRVLGIATVTKTTAALSVSEDPQQPLRMRTVASKAFDDSGAARFEHLQAGTYHLTISGSGPFAHFGTDVTIADLASAEKQVSITPAHLKVVVDKSHAPVENAEVYLKNMEGGWSGTVKTTESGEAESELWQFGEFSTMVRTPASQTPVMGHMELAAEKDITHEFHLPSASIAGVITAADDQRPVAGGEVQMALQTADTQLNLHTQAGDDGRYRFDLVPPGQASLRAVADGFLPSAPVRTNVAPDTDAPIALDFKLARGITRRLHVQSGSGQPLAAAEVFAESAAGENLAHATTGADGIATIATALDGAIVYVVPREGSFAVKRLDSHDDGTDVAITVADGACSLIVTAQTDTTPPRAVRDMAVLFRFDGEVIPIPVMIALQRLQGLDLRTSADGRAALRHLPAGYYEVWPFMPANASDEDFMSGLTYTQPPVSMAVRPGENSATLKFAVRKHL